MQNQGTIGVRPDNFFSLNGDALLSSQESPFDCEESYSAALASHLADETLESTHSTTGAQTQDLH